MRFRAHQRTIVKKLDLKKDERHLYGPSAKEVGRVEVPTMKFLMADGKGDPKPTVERVHRFIEASGHGPSGKHHEIYLSDIRKADPAKWKTVIRQPMR